MKQQVVQEADFSKTVVNAVEVISHVWDQITHLKTRLDQRLPAILKNEHIQADIDELKDEYSVESNHTEDVSIAWLWRYKLTRTFGRGRRPVLGWLYVMIRIAPAAGEEYTDTFTPYLSIHVDHPECEDCVISDFDSLQNYQEGWDKFEANLFPAATLCRAVQNGSGGKDVRSAAVFIPLGDIDHTNIEDNVIGPTSKLAAHYLQQWGLIHFQ